MLLLKTASGEMMLVGDGPYPNTEYVRGFAANGNQISIKSKQPTPTKTHSTLSTLVAHSVADECRGSVTSVPLKFTSASCMAPRLQNMTGYSTEQLWKLRPQDRQWFGQGHLLMVAGPTHAQIRAERVCVGLATSLPSKLDLSLCFCACIVSWCPPNIPGYSPEVRGLWIEARHVENDISPDTLQGDKED